MSTLVISTRSRRVASKAARPTGVVASFCTAASGWQLWWTEVMDSGVLPLPAGVLLC